MTDYYFGLIYFNKKVPFFKRIWYRWKAKRKAKKKWDKIGENIERMRNENKRRNLIKSKG